MSLFRLTYLDEPDADSIGDLTVHMTTARTRASNAAAEHGRAILITRIVAAGHKPCIVALPDGSFQRPPTTAPLSPREDCVRNEGKLCFCSPCRAIRRGT